MTHTSAPHANADHSIAALWADARAWLGELLKRFGGPARILIALAARTRGAVKRRLAALDALVLKLLLIEAVQLAPTPAPARAPAAARRRCAVAHRLEDPACPETWRVRYRPRLPRIPRRVAATRARPGAAPRDAAAVARLLARRCEALRRLIADPRPAIRALARKLRALGASAHAFARRIAIKPAPRGASNPMRLAHAIVHAVDAINTS
jgi:hypothetical protein